MCPFICIVLIIIIISFENKSILSVITICLCLVITEKKISMVYLHHQLINLKLRHTSRITGLYSPLCPSVNIALQRIVIHITLGTKIGRTTIPPAREGSTSACATSPVEDSMTWKSELQQEAQSE